MYLRQLRGEHNEYVNCVCCKSLVLRVRKLTGETDFEWGADVVAQSVPPDIKLVDKDCIYYIMYFKSIHEANIWLEEYIRLNGK